jgi:hypothetical protein
MQQQILLRQQRIVRQLLQGLELRRINAAGREALRIKRRFRSRDQ